MLIPNLEDLKKNGFQFAPIEYYTSSDIVIREISRKLKVCQERHSCSDKSIPYLPTRIIDVGSADGKWPPHLFVPRKGVRGQYTALSYCWGGDQMTTKTTSDRLHMYMKRIEVDSLPKTAQHALIVTRKLGFRYLWVDAFCIVQDSPQDKAKEIDTMGSIYQNATVTIAASCARGSDVGFLQRFSRMHTASLQFQLPNKPSSHVAIAEKTPYWVKGPLDSRAWAFQEFHLSARLLFYGYRGDVRWYCQSDRFSPLLEKRQPLSLDEAQRRSKKESYYFNRPIPPGRGLSIKWTALVEDFSERDLTCSEDRLPALAGIVRYLKDFLQDDYLAGTWKNSLVEHLTWSINSNILNRGGYEPCKTAPSWSWASVNRPVRFYGFQSGVQVEVIACSIDPVEKAAPFGQVREGRLTIRAAVLKPSTRVNPPWDEGRLHLTLDHPRLSFQSDKIDSREFELVRLTLSDAVQSSWGEKFHRFHGIVVTRREDGRYKRIGSFVHCHVGNLFQNSEGFYESRNCLSVEWEMKELVII
jgi:hypothetical protein